MLWSCFGSAFEKWNPDYLWLQCRERLRRCNQWVIEMNGQQIVSSLHNLPRNRLATLEEEMPIWRLFGKEEMRKSFRRLSLTSQHCCPPDRAHPKTFSCSATRAKIISRLWPSMSKSWTAQFSQERETNNEANSVNMNSTAPQLSTFSIDIQNFTFSNFVENFTVFIHFKPFKITFLFYRRSGIWKSNARCWKWGDHSSDCSGGDGDGDVGGDGGDGGDGDGDVGGDDKIPCARVGIGLFLLIFNLCI